MGILKLFLATLGFIKNFWILFLILGILIIVAVVYTYLRGPLAILDFFRKNWKILTTLGVIGALVAAFYIMSGTITNLKGDLESSSAQVETLNGKVNELETTARNLEENQGRIDDIQNAVSKLKRNQQSVRERMDDVQVQTNDQPFTDPGMQQRADIMRQYQEDSYKP